jgi:hypothetical protein
MSFLKKFFKPKQELVITFVNTVPGYAEAYPVLEAKSIKHSWIEKNAEQVQNFRQNTLKNCPISQFKNAFNSTGFISKCPGIRDFINSGYIVTTPCDFVIETDGDGINFSSADLAQQPSPLDTPAFKISKHPKEQLHDYTSLPQNTLKTVIKVVTGWHLIPNEDYVFLVTTPFYNGEDRFTTAGGIYDPFLDSQINPFLFWHVLKGRELVKAGTPLAQYIPIPRKFVQPTLKCRTSTVLDNRRISAVFTSVRSSTDVSYRDKRREIVKKIYNSDY